MAESGEPDEYADEAPPWDEEVDRTLRTVVPHTMPGISLGLYARWWQLESWLRELAYVELRASMGMSWTDAVRAAAGRQLQDAPYTHMVGTDNDNPLAYLDYSQLVDLIKGRWEIFQYALIEQNSWDGRQTELKRIRHRIGHLRRPHNDDIRRLEQILRDLERGAFIALASYNRRIVPNTNRHSDRISSDWIDGSRLSAEGLIEHAERQYDITCRVSASRRPWATWPANLDRAPGILWHVDFSSYRRSIDPSKLWNHSNLNACRPLVMHMTVDNPDHVGFTFSGADDPEAISDAIEEVLGAVLSTSSPSGKPQDWTTSNYPNTWQIRMRAIDYRVLSGTGWNIVDESMVPITNFGAGSGVTSAPAW
jgi:hypothetical protein